MLGLPRPIPPPFYFPLAPCLLKTFCPILPHSFVRHQLLVLIRERFPVGRCTHLPVMSTVGHTAWTAKVALYWKEMQVHSPVWIGLLVKVQRACDQLNHWAKSNTWASASYFDVGCRYIDHVKV